MRDLSNWEWILLTVLATLVYLYWSDPMARHTVLVLIVILLVITFIRWAIHFLPQNRLCIHIDKELDPHELLGYFFRGRVHNGPRIHIKNAFISVVDFKGKETNIKGMNLQWKMGNKEKIDIGGGQKDCIFDIALASKHSAFNLLGFMNGVKHDPRIENGEIEITLRLFGEEIDSEIQRVVKIEVNESGGANAVKIFEER